MTEARVCPECGAELARSFPQLEIVELLGRGGMGLVYNARHSGPDRQGLVPLGGTGR